MNRLYLDSSLFEGTEEDFIEIEEFFSKEWKLNGKYHRDNGPAIIWKSGTRHWYINGKLHRERDPAKIHKDGKQEWYANGKRHRKCGPAIIWPNGSLEWYVNGESHREDGPAKVFLDGYEEYWINGKIIKKYNTLPIKKNKNEEINSFENKTESSINFLEPKKSFYKRIKPEFSIYILRSNFDDQIYIGMSCNLINRFQQHLVGKDGTERKKAWIKASKENPSRRIIMDELFSGLSYKEAVKKEMETISYCVAKFGKRVLNSEVKRLCVEMYLDGVVYSGNEKSFIKEKDFKDKRWIRNKKIHRETEEGPALILSNGYMAWYKDGNLHREDGPAVIHPDGYEEFYNNGNKIYSN